MGSSTFWEEFKDLMLSANDCTPGCGCSDDRFVLTRERVNQWKQYTDKEKVQLLISGLDQIRKAGLSESEFENLVEITNLFFNSLEDAKAWVDVWRKLLIQKPESGEDQIQRTEWLDSELQSLPLTVPGASAEPVEVMVNVNGVLEWLDDQRKWRVLATTPLRSRIPKNRWYRLSVDSGTVDGDLSWLPFDDCFPALVDLRLVECNALTDKCFQSISKMQGLKVLSLGSLLIRGTNLNLLANLPNLKRLDLSGCMDLSNSAVGELRLKMPDLQILLPTEPNSVGSIH